MLVHCVNLSRTRTILKALYKQETFVVHKRNYWTPKFWNTPFGYLLKPVKAKKGSPEYDAYFRNWGRFIAAINLCLFAHLLYQGVDFLEPLKAVDLADLQFNREKVQKKEAERDQQSEELLKLVDKANKPFEPISNLPDWPPPFFKEELEKLDKEFGQYAGEFGKIEIQAPTAAQSPTPDKKEEEKVPSKNQNETS